jgi:ferredoxin-type protein NapH
MALEIVSEAMKLLVFAGLALAGMLVIFIWKKNLTTKISYLRLWVQVASVVGIFYIFASLNWLLLLLLSVFVMSLFLGRFFCGWLCPFGLYMDLVTQVRKVFKMRYRKLSVRLNGDLNRLRYGIIVVFLLLPLFFSSIGSWTSNSALALSGPFRPIMSLLSPLEPLIIPWKSLIILQGINISYPYASDLTFYLTENLALIAISIFVGITLVASLFVRRFWCRFCPTGISLAAINRFKFFKGVPLLHIYKEEEKCTKCGICERVCPPQVTEVYEQKGGKIATSMCLMCLRCVEMCPYEGCLKVNVAGKTLIKSRNWLEPATTD